MWRREQLVSRLIRQGGRRQNPLFATTVTAIAELEVQQRRGVPPREVLSPPPAEGGMGTWAGLAATMMAADGVQASPVVAVAGRDETQLLMAAAAARRALEAGDEDTELEEGAASARRRRLPAETLRPASLSFLGRLRFCL